MGRRPVILAGIDGTGGGLVRGSGREREYDSLFENSFVKRLCRPSPTTKYYRGPVDLGGELPKAVNEATAHVRRCYSGRHGRDSAVLLTGYSRGATGVVLVARNLERVGIPVHALLLFDCVDRYAGGDARVIPGNVKHTFHVRRDPSGKSRESFGNDGTQVRSRQQEYKEVFYLGTHGAMGGMPWREVGSQRANEFINEAAFDAARGAMTATNALAAVIPARIAIQATRQGVQQLLGNVSVFASTNVTYQMDRTASNRIWNDIQPWLDTHGFPPSSRTPD